MSSLQKTIAFLAAFAAVSVSWGFQIPPSLPPGIIVPSPRESNVTVLPDANATLPIKPLRSSKLQTIEQAGRDAEGAREAIFGGVEAGRDAEGAREAIFGGFGAGRDAEGAREAIFGGFWAGRDAELPWKAYWATRLTAPSPFPHVAASACFCSRVECTSETTMWCSVQKKRMLHRGCILLHRGCTVPWPGPLP